MSDSSLQERHTFQAAHSPIRGVCVRFLHLLTVRHTSKNGLTEASGRRCSLTAGTDQRHDFPGAVTTIGSRCVSGFCHQLDKTTITTVSPAWGRTCSMSCTNRPPSRCPGCVTALGRCIRCHQDDQRPTIPGRASQHRKQCVRFVQPALTNASHPKTVSPRALGRAFLCLPQPDLHHDSGASTSIGDYAFYDTGLTSVHDSRSVTSIRGVWTSFWLHFAHIRHHRQTCQPAREEHMFY